MTRKTGSFVLLALALSVACLGVLLALRCERGEPGDKTVEPVAGTLTVGSGPQN